MSHFLLGLTFVTSMHAELKEGIMGILKNPPTALVVMVTAPLKGGLIWLP